METGFQVKDRYLLYAMAGLLGVVAVKNIFDIFKKKDHSQYPSISVNASKNLMRRDSLTNFTQYHPGSPRNSTQRVDNPGNISPNPNLTLNTSNYLMDESFEKAMLEAKRNVRYFYTIIKLNRKQKHKIFQRY